MHIDEFLECVRQGHVPPTPPDQLRYGSNPKYMTLRYEWREECIKRDMWAMVDLAWTKKLADWINGRPVLEVMAGRGWLAKALSFHGVPIHATDDFSWDKTSGYGFDPVYPVLNCEAREAIKNSEMYKVLIMSWPPYDNPIAYEVIKRWGANRPIVYIGEGEGGCNATDEFFEHFQESDEELDFPMPQWHGLYDSVCVGNYEE